VRQGFPRACAEGNVGMSVPKTNISQKRCARYWQTLLMNKKPLLLRGLLLHREDRRVFQLLSVAYCLSGWFDCLDQKRNG
jgi:hypothetical protein